MTPAMHHCKKPSRADPVPGSSGTTPEASAPALGPTSPWALISTKNPIRATGSGIPNPAAPTSNTTAVTPVAARPTPTTTRVGALSASRAATSVATVNPTAFNAKSTEYSTGDRPFIDCSTNAEVAT